MHMPSSKRAYLKYEPRRGLASDSPVDFEMQDRTIDSYCLLRLPNAYPARAVPYVARILDL